MKIVTDSSVMFSVEDGARRGMTVLPLVWNGDTETAEISAATTYDNQLRWGVITLRYR